MQVIVVGGFHVEVRFKPIKNLHVGVYPPDGRVRVSAPERLDLEAVRMAIVTRIGWIRREQRKFAGKVRQTRRQYVSRESHYYLGKRYLLKVDETARRNFVAIRGKRSMELRVVPGTPVERREEIMAAWYRERLREIMEPMIVKWQKLLSVHVADWRIRSMKTMWGSCNTKARRLWFNTELAKKPPSCIQYVVVHEMTHLLERHHNDRFVALLDRHLPTWRKDRDELNRLPLKEEDWQR